MTWAYVTVVALKLSIAEQTSTYTNTISLYVVCYASSASISSTEMFTVGIKSEKQTTSPMQ